MSTEYRIIVIGNVDVGKTSLTRRWSQNVFLEDQDEDQEDDPEEEVTKSVGDVLVTLTDTAGQERFRGLTTSYYRNADAVFHCFDVSDNDSWKDVEDWLNDSRRLALDAIMILVGCKADLRNDGKGVVEMKTIVNWAKEKQFAFYLETSAKDNTNIQKLFTKTVAILSGQKPNDDNESGNINGVESGGEQKKK